VLCGSRCRYSWSGPEGPVGGCYEQGCVDYREYLVVLVGVVDEEVNGAYACSDNEVVVDSNLQRASQSRPYSDYDENARETCEEYGNNDE